MPRRVSPTAILAVCVALCAAVPLLFVVIGAATAGGEVWRRLYETRLGLLLPNTLRLLLAVGVMTAVIGVSAAWFVTRFDFHGKRFWEWAMALPLAVPGYVLAYVYASLAAPGGMVAGVLYSFWGVAVTLSLVNYPYVYLLSRAAFLRQGAAMDDAARMLGASPLRRFWTVDVRLAAPGIAAGLALGLMEVMADFGTVALLRYPTFTEAVYRQMTARFDPSGAAALASVLAMITLVLLVVERRARGRKRFVQGSGRFAPRPLRRARPAVRALFLGLMAAVFCLAFAVPVALLAVWGAGVLWQEGFDARLLGFAFNSVSVSAAGATLAVVLAFPVAALVTRRPNRFSKTIFTVSTLGYSLPGPVVAVGLLLSVGLLFPWLMGGFSVLLLAYVVRFMPIAVQAEGAALAHVSSSMDEAARTVGAGAWRRHARVVFPLIKPGLLTGWVVVFLDCMKELPATLMLRPIAFDTLAVRVWMDASESLWELAALPALLMILIGALPVAVLIGRRSTVRGGHG